MNKTFWKTTITIVVLSEDRPAVEGIQDVLREMDDGAYSGSISTEYDLITPQEAAKALIDQGSDPEFFGLDEEGNEIER